MVHLLNQVIDEVVDLGLRFTELDYGHLLLSLVILVLVRTPLQGTDIRMVQVAADPLEAVQRGPELQMTEELRLRNWIEHEEARVSNNDAPGVEYTIGILGTRTILLEAGEDLARGCVLAFVMPFLDR